MAVEGQRLMTKTQHYRKVTKPLLERKRRARMNLYLDELKDLIVDGMEEQGEHVNKLEKADILEMTVTYLRSRKHEIAASVKQQTAPGINLDKFRAGYTQAAYEVSKVFSSLPGVDLKFGTLLMKQLGHQLKDMRPEVHSLPPPAATPPPAAADYEFAKPNGYQMHHHSQQQDILDRQSSPLLDIDDDHVGDVWRPW